MDIRKEAQGGQAATATAEDMALINGYARRELTAEEVYVFSVRLCDNQIDRDGECFPRQTLEELAPLFLGKCGLFDHSWSAQGQSARLYRTQVEEDTTVDSQTGEVYAHLKGWAYMVRTEENRGLIAEIEGGIKREVSVGCAVARTLCSICGGDSASCSHQRGECYDGQLCYGLLVEARDAYEFSFVAVPAQPRAGVMKRKGARSLKTLCKEFPEVATEVTRLEGEAKLGRRYISQLRDEVVRLGLLAQKELKRDTLLAIAGRMDEGELVELKAAYARQAGERYPISPQLRYSETQYCGEQETEFLI